MGFRDEKADDQKGGLFDEGRSLKGLPAGSNIFAGRDSAAPLTQAFA